MSKEINNDLKDVQRAVSEAFDGRINFKLAKKYIPCVFHQQNKCIFGQNCRFQH
jgi:hypothetical protein